MDKRGISFIHATAKIRFNNTECLNAFNLVVACNLHITLWKRTFHHKESAPLLKWSQITYSTPVADQLSTVWAESYSFPRLLNQPWIGWWSIDCLFSSKRSIYIFYNKVIIQSIRAYCPTSCLAELTPIAADIYVRCPLHILEVQALPM